MGFSTSTFSPPSLCSHRFTRRTNVGSASSFFWSSSRETMRSRLMTTGSLLTLGWGTKVKDLRIGDVDILGLLLLDGYSQKSIYSRRSYSRARKGLSKPRDPTILKLH